MEMRTCEFCKCRTNAKLRRCCDAGYKADLKPSPQPPPNAPHRRNPPTGVTMKAVRLDLHLTAEEIDAIKREVTARNESLDDEDKWSDWRELARVWAVQGIRDRLAAERTT